MAGRIPLLACVALSALVALPAPNADAASMSRFEERQKYTEALRYLFSGQSNRFSSLAAELADYPLAPYLEYFDMSRHISRYSYTEIADFMGRNADSPLAPQLMRSWLYSLAIRGRWQGFIDYYQDEFTSPILACYHLLALYRTGQEAAALDLTTEQWLVGFSRPDECDAMFNIWRGAGRLTPELAWQRMVLALRADNTTLAGYVMNFMPRELRDAAQLFQQVERTPATLKREGQFLPDSPQMREIVLQGFTWLARSDANLAADLWPHYVANHTFTREEIDSIWLTIAMQLAAQRDPEHRIGSLPVDLIGHAALLESLIRLALYQKDWGQALVFINALPQELQNGPRWHFWKARVLAMSADAADRDSATAILRQLAAKRGYYSFLAADLIGAPYAMDNLPTNLTRGELRAVEQIPGIQRALELFVLKERTRARAEWRFAVREFDDRKLAAAARVAQDWGWYDQSIQTQLDSDRFDDLRVRFPLAYHDTFLAESRQADIPVTWTLAIARQESAFMPDAKSSAGALGLMQLMPRTARFTADTFGIPYRNTTELIDPVTNISLGSAYLGQMLRRFGNNRILASAAYNAGPERVRRWIEDNGSDCDVWIETIPFGETRSYVQNVLMFSVIFAYRLDQAQQMILPEERAQFAEQQQVSGREAHASGEPSS